MIPAQTSIPTPWITHYDPWFEATLDYPDLTLYELYLKAANRFPDYPALTYFGRTFSYLAVHEKIEEAAEALTGSTGRVSRLCGLGRACAAQAAPGLIFRAHQFA